MFVKSMPGTRILKAQKTPADARYFNRELSWLKFNERVLEEASNPAHPLLERLRFLSISGSNLDEFFMVRVAGLRGQQQRRIEELSIDGRTPSEQLADTVAAADRLMVRQQKLWRKLMKELGSEGIKIVQPSAIGKTLQTQVGKYFREQVLPRSHPTGIGPCPSISIHSQPRPKPYFRYAPQG